MLTHKIVKHIITHRIHGAAIYGLPWIPSTKTPNQCSHEFTSSMDHGGLMGFYGGLIGSKK
jgi:hypothetical protein